MQGKQNVEREFELFLNKISESAPISFDLSFENVDDETPNELNTGKENDLKQIIYILEWFKNAEPNNPQLYDKIIRNRSQIILDALKRLYKL